VISLVVDGENKVHIISSRYLGTEISPPFHAIMQVRDMKSDDLNNWTNEITDRITTDYVGYPFAKATNNGDIFMVYNKIDGNRRRPYLRGFKNNKWTDEVCISQSDTFECVNPKLVKGQYDDEIIAYWTDFSSDSIAFREVVQTYQSITTNVNMITNPPLDFNIYPNPSIGFISIDLNGYELDTSVEILSIKGELIRSIALKPTSINHLDLYYLANGIYIFKIDDTYKRIIINNNQ